MRQRCGQAFLINYLNAAPLMHLHTMHTLISKFPADIFFVIIIALKRITDVKLYCSIMAFSPHQHTQE